MIRNLLFDLGGVFLRLTREESIRQFVALGIHDAGKLLDPYCQSGLFLDLELGRYDAITFAEKLSQVYEVNVTPEQVGDALLRFVSHVEEYKFDFISTQLPEEIRLFLISNTNDYIFSWAESPEFLSSGRPLSSFFERVYTSYELGMCKPDPTLFAHIIRDAGIDPAETLFVDDGPANTATARKLGFVTYCPENGEDWTPVIRKMLLP